MNTTIAIRPAAASDFEALYALAKNTPELKVSATEDFMDPEEFKWSMQDPNGIFLIAEDDGRCAGFIYATFDGKEHAYPQKWACLVYIAIDPAFRKQGIATALYEACAKRLKAQGIAHLYTWAYPGSDGATVAFMKRQGFAEGHQYIWMDKKI